MFQLNFLVTMAFNMIFFKLIQGQTAAGWNGMMGQTMYAGAHLNRAISTGAGPRSAVDDVRGLPMFGIMGQAVNVKNMPSPAMVKQMLMMQMTRAMALLIGMGLDETGPLGGNGRMVVDDGARTSQGMVVDDGKRMPVVLDDGRPMPVDNAMTMSGTGGMPTNLGNNEMPWNGGMGMMNPMGIQQRGGGVPMGQTSNGNQRASEGGETTTASVTTSAEEPPVAASNSMAKGEAPPGDAAAQSKDV